MSIGVNLVVKEAVEQRDEESLERYEELSYVGPDSETQPRSCRWVDD